MTVKRQYIKYEHRYSVYGKWHATLPEKPDQTYFTNARGEGLFVQYANGDVRQLQGTGQFRPRNFAHFKSLMRAIRREIYDD